MRALLSRLMLAWAVLSVALLLIACTSEKRGAPQTLPSTGAAHAHSATKPEQPRATAPVEPDALTAQPEAPEPVPTLSKIYLQELGAPLPRPDLEYLLSALAAFFPNDVVVLPPRELPAEAYYPPRKRYRADKILDSLVARTPADAQVVVALTTVDISATKGAYEDWGILGLATISGQECVISRFRAAREAKTEQHVRERLAKVVVHEIGHTLGLEHCPNHGCLMEDGKGSVLTTDHEYDFCSACRASVGAKLIHRTGLLPWKRPASLDSASDQLPP